MPTPATTSTDSVRRRRPARVSGEEREQAILATFERLLEHQPFHDISVDDLARGAGISRPTFYFYFASKEAVLLTVLERLVDEAQQDLGQAPELLAHDRVQAWRFALGASHAAWTANRHVIRAAAESRPSNAEVRELWDGLFGRFVAETTAAIESERAGGAAPPGIPAADLALCLVRMNEGIFASSLGDGGPSLDDDRVLDTLLDVWLRAIYGSPPAGYAPPHGT